MSDGRRRAAALAALQRGLGWLRDAVADEPEQATEVPAEAVESTQDAPPEPSADQVEEPYDPAPLVREGIGEVVELDPEDVLLDAVQLVEQVGVGWELTFLDVRGDAVRALGMIPDAVALPARSLVEAASELDAGRSWVVVAETDAEAAEGALDLRRAGHDDVFAMQGGVAAWKRAGGPIAGVS